jgi:hypothetical protein
MESEQGLFGFQDNARVAVVEAMQSEHIWKTEQTLFAFYLKNIRVFMTML